MKSQTADRHYKWIALSNTTLGMLVATINSSIVLISLPAIFNGIHLNPLEPANSAYLLWMLMGYMIVTAVLVVSLGRVGDMYGRVRMYNLGFAVFTLASIGLSLVFNSGPVAAIEMIGLRIVQGVGGALLMANSVAILTDAFPENERGLAMGVNGMAALAGSFIGLILGGVLSAVDWHLVFLVSVPFGVFGTFWAYVKLKETGQTKEARIDWLGNVTFAAGLIALLAGITGAIQPGGKSAMTWGTPQTLAELIGGVALLGLFLYIESRTSDPMFHLGLFRNRGFAAGNVANFLAAVGRGGLMFILIIWLQGIWLPLHGYSYTSTPLWAGIYMLPQTFGFLIAGPLSGYLSDRHGARLFATLGMAGAAVSFVLLLLLPANFEYVWFALILLLNGISMGMFSSPNTAAIMNTVPPEQRGAASGMRSALMNTGMTLSVGLFFSLIIVGLSQHLPRALYSGLMAHGVASALARRIAALPPVSSMFAAFLGYNPMRTMLGSAPLTHAQSAYLFGRSFFPSLISTPFMDGMHLAFDVSTALMAVAAIASYLRGSRSPARKSAAAPVITISASIGSRGMQVAQLIATRLNLPLLDRAIPMEEAQRLDVQVGNTLVFPEGVEETVRAIARGGGGVVLGRGAALALRGWKRCMNVRIDAPFDVRAERLMEREAIERREAEARVRRADAVQSLYVRHFYDEDINDASLYDLKLDGSKGTAQDAAETVVRAAMPLFSMTIKE